MPHLLFICVLLFFPMLITWFYTEWGISESILVTQSGQFSQEQSPDRQSIFEELLESAANLELSFMAVTWKTAYGSR